MQQTSQSLGITGFALLQMCCKCVALVADVVADTVADTFHLLQKLLHLPFIVSCNNPQQVIFYHFFVSATENVQLVQHNLQRIFIHEYSIFIHLQQFLQQF